MMLQLLVGKHLARVSSTVAVSSGASNDFPIGIQNVPQIRPYILLSPRLWIWKFQSVQVEEVDEQKEAAAQNGSHRHTINRGPSCKVINRRFEEDTDCQPLRLTISYFCLLTRCYSIY